jgi:hypothetical protein
VKFRVYAFIFAINTSAFAALFLVHHFDVFAGLAREPLFPSERSA